MIAEKTGWSEKEILHEHSFAELLFKIADAPRLIKKGKKEDNPQTEDELAAWFGTTIE